MLIRRIIPCRKVISNQYIRKQNAITIRHQASQNKNNSGEETNLKRTQRKEAPRWLQKMAPTKGGRELPTAKEAAAIGIVVAVGYYAWFVDPPKKEDEG